MFEWSELILFAAAVSVLVFVPGPNTLYVIARSFQQGRVAGLVSALGVETGTLVHATAAALGLSALLLSSVLIFSIVKYAGAAYLIFLGVKTLLTRPQLSEEKKTEAMTLPKVFSQAVVINILNPKAVLFFLAFLPQFIRAERGNITAQILILGSMVAIIGFISGSFYSLVAGSIGKRLRGNVKFLQGQRYFAGTVYIILGAATALTGTGREFPAVK